MRNCIVHRSSFNKKVQIQFIYQQQCLRSNVEKLFSLLVRCNRKYCKPIKLDVARFSKLCTHSDLNESVLQQNVWPAQPVPNAYNALTRLQRSRNRLEEWVPLEPSMRKNAYILYSRPGPGLPSSQPSITKQLISSVC